MKLTRFVRLSAVILTLVYAYFMGHVGASTSFSWRIFYKSLVVGAFLYSSLWLLTTDFSKKWKLLSLILFLPAMFITPAVMLFFSPYLAIAFLGILPLLFVKYYPWRKLQEASEFVTHIKNGDYPGYELRAIRDQETPVARKTRARLMRPKLALEPQDEWPAWS